MGTVASSEQSASDYLKRLTFVQQTEDRNFGRIDIFRSQEPPYQYIMNCEKTFHEKDVNFLKHLNLMNELKSKSHKNIARIHLVDAREENHMCIKDTKLSTYLSYYNFTLKDTIEKKRLTGSYFPESELWYVLSCLLEIANYLKAHQISFGDYCSSNIYLTPEGYLKIYLHRLYPDNKHNAYYTALIDKQSAIQTHLLAPEQLDSLNKSYYDICFDVYRADMFSIGMLLLELIFLDSPKFYYNLEHFEINYGRIKYNLSTVKQTYSREFMQLLMAILEPDPAQRIDFDAALSFVEQARAKISFSGAIRVTDDEQMVSKRKNPLHSNSLNQSTNLDTKRVSESQVTNNSLSSQPPDLRSLNIGHKLMVTPIGSYHEKKQSVGRVSGDCSSKHSTASSTGRGVLQEQNVGVGSIRLVQKKGSTPMDLSTMSSVSFENRVNSK